MMRLTRKLYSEPEEKDDEETWKRNRNIGIVGAGTGTLIYGLGRGIEKGKSGFAKSMQRKIREEAAKKEGQTAQTINRLKGGGLAFAGASALAAGGSEIIRRKKLKKKKDDENKT